MKKPFRFNILYVLLAIWLGLYIQGAWNQYKNIMHISYSQFQTLLKEGKVEEVFITSDQIRGTLKEDIEGKKNFIAVRVDSELSKELDAANIKYSAILENTWLKDIVSWVLPAIIFFGIWIFVMKKIAQKGGLGGGNLLPIGKSKAKIYVEESTKVTFEDVAGVDEAEAELQEIVSFLKSPKEFGKLGARMPKGILLIGPPGTGKTLIAKAVAGEANVPFFSISGSEFVELFVGVGAARVRDLFEQARLKSPCIIFIDELDALGRARSSYSMGGHDEKEQTLNQLLVELDGFDSTSGIILLAATNRPEILDPALLRSGRFDRQVLLDKPDKNGRIDILKVHIKKVKLENNVSLDQIAALTPGFTGADLANLVNEAALVATRQKAEFISLDHFTLALERIIAGLEKKNRLLNELERKIVAYHEVGHALVSCALKGSDPVHKISIIPRGIGALGYTIQRPTEDRYLMTQKELENKMSVLMGGRAAEFLIFNEISTGAADDLAKATSIARSMVTRFGMDKDLGNVSYDSDPVSFLNPTVPEYSPREYSDKTASEIDHAINALIEKSYYVAVQILTTYKQVIENTAKELLEKETLTDKDLARLFAEVSKR